MDFGILMVVIYAVSVFGVLITQLIQKKEEFGKLLAYSFIMSLIYGMVSLVTVAVMWIIGVIASHLLFGTNMESFLYIFLIATFQLVFYAVGLFVAFFFVKDNETRQPLKHMLYQVLLVIIVSTPIVYLLVEKTVGF